MEKKDYSGGEADESEDKIRGILFDKDGTIIDFYTLWMPVVEKVTDDVLSQFAGIEPGDGRHKTVRRDLMDIFGIYPEAEEIDPDGNLAAATVASSARQMADYMREKEMEPAVHYQELAEEIMSVMKESFFQVDFVDFVKPTADLDELFSLLKERGLYIGIATADTRPSTLTILKELDVMEYLDYIACGDDDIPDKPDPAVVDEFCEKFALSPSQVAFVGDTPTDMKTARNAGAGMAAGVLCGVGTRESLADLADVLMETPEEILEHLNDLL